MNEEKYYNPIKEKLEELFHKKGKDIYLEITAKKGLSEKLKQAIPQGREITFVFLKKKPDIFGYVTKDTSKDLVVIEVKEKIAKINDVYQAKLYKEVFDTRYSFLISLTPIAEEIKRLCKNTYNILHSAQDAIYCFLVLGYFNPENNDFIDWFEENPFENEIYWE